MVLAAVLADVQLGQVQTERLGGTQDMGKPAIGDPVAEVAAQ